MKSIIQRLLAITVIVGISLSCSPNNTGQTHQKHTSLFRGLYSGMNPAEVQNAALNDSKLNVTKITDGYIYDSGDGPQLLVGPYYNANNLLYKVDLVPIGYRSGKPEYNSILDNFRLYFPESSFKITETFSFPDFNTIDEDLMYKVLTAEFRSIVITEYVNIIKDKDYDPDYMKSDFGSSTSEEKDIGRKETKFRSMYSHEYNYTLVIVDTNYMQPGL